MFEISSVHAMQVTCKKRLDREKIYNLFTARINAHETYTVIHKIAMKDVYKRININEETHR